MFQDYLNEPGIGSRPLAARRTSTYIPQVFALITVCLLLSVRSAKADSVDNVAVVASFTNLDPGSTDTTTNPTPKFNLTGDFTLDLTTSTVTSFVMSLTAAAGQSGSDYAFTSLTGTGTAQCQGVLAPSCPSSSDLGWWDFTFRDANASIDLSTVFGSNQLSSAEPVYLCSEPMTYYGNTVEDSPPCYTTSMASYDGTSGVIYNVPPDGTTSGYLLAASDPTPTPEPAVLAMLGSGIIFLLVLGARRFSGGRRCQQV